MYLILLLPGRRDTLIPRLIEIAKHADHRPGRRRSPIGNSRLQPVTETLLSYEAKGIQPLWAASVL